MNSFYRKSIPALGVFSLVLFLLFITYSTNVRQSWRELPQSLGLGEALPDPSPSVAGESGSGTQTGQTSTPAETNLAHYRPRPVFEPGTPKPPGSNYSRVLVIPRTKEEDVDWIEQEIPEVPTAIYVVDDPSAPLHPPKNKGHEVMVYLTWIIDNYDDLPDVAIFMHAHRYSWHNDDLLGNDAAEMIRALSPERVVREGYMNVRCHWDPGCPAWMHPGTVEEDINKQEEVLLAKGWSELFPLDPIPSVLAQPCCAQFALSAQRIRAIPRSTYVFYRDWLLRTPLSDYISGRVWEYVWQFVFTGENVYCPETHVCYCDGFGVCFGGRGQSDAWFEKRETMRGFERELREWHEKEEAIQNAQEEGRLEELSELEVPELGRDKVLEAKVERLRKELDIAKEEAFVRGRDPRNRALEAGREWHDGEGSSRWENS
ncbi:hypothetical protein BDY21DRAFT_278942 [Lineolata rhizophorae]|uniref:Uncharacterized protein n=1 Tax=Lineolata rhizophorae TaxID=578093 RepID=A0A6A6PBS1_9PEZI|nr:hypothetical protein BDY21DRAFT_278942 [Lineolata rhizophorae]